MKKNFLFKWVAVLGAISLLANTMLPWLQVYAMVGNYTLDSTDFDANWKFTINIDGTNYAGVEVKDQWDFNDAFKLDYNAWTNNFNDTWTIVDHTNFAEASTNQLAGYYSAYPTEASQDWTSWPAFTPSKFPRLVVNHNFDGNTTIKVTYKDGDENKVFTWKPSDKFWGTEVARNAWIMWIPEDLWLWTFYNNDAQWSLIGESFDKNNIIKVELIPDWMDENIWNSMDFNDYTASLTEDITNSSDKWMIVDHTNFAEASTNQLAGYYSAYPTEASQDWTSWPAFTPSKFPWLVVSHNFDGNTTIKVTYNKVFTWKPSDKFWGTEVARNAWIMW